MTSPGDSVEQTDTVATKKHDHVYHLLRYDSRCNITKFVSADGNGT